MMARHNLTKFSQTTISSPLHMLCPGGISKAAMHAIWNLAPMKAADVTLDRLGPMRGLTFKRVELLI